MSTPTLTPPLAKGCKAEFEVSSTHDQLNHVLDQLDITQSHMDQASELAETGACSAMLIHEINNLMTQVGGRASLAIRSPNNQAYTRRALDIAYHSSEQIKALCELFLSQTPIFEKKTPISNLHGAHKQVLEFVSDADIHLYGFDFDCETDLPDVLISSAALEHILLNLYLNAVKASNKNAPNSARHAQFSLFDHSGAFTDSIKLSAECSTWNTSCSPQQAKTEKNDQHNAQHMVRITVEDTGVGMDQEQIARALSPGEYKPQGTGGHGIGLAVCQRLIRQASGTLEIESTPGGRHKDDRLTAMPRAWCSHSKRSSPGSLM